MKLVLFAGPDSGLSAAREAALREWASGRDMEVVVFANKTEALRSATLLHEGDIFVGGFFELSYRDYRDMEALFDMVQLLGDRLTWGSGVMLFDSTVPSAQHQQMNEEMATHQKAVSLIDYTASAEEVFLMLDSIATVLAAQVANSP